MGAATQNASHFSVPLRVRAARPHTTGLRRGEQLHEIAYQPFRGPAFIWSVAWSAIGNRLVVGCTERPGVVVHTPTPFSILLESR